MGKNIELNMKNKDLRKLIDGLHQIQNIAFYGYNNNKDNQELIDMKARELIELINSKILVEDSEEGSTNADDSKEEVIFYHNR